MKRRKQKFKTKTKNKTKQNKRLHTWQAARKSFLISPMFAPFCKRKLTISNLPLYFKKQYNNNNNNKISNNQQKPKERTYTSSWFKHRAFVVVWMGCGKIVFFLWTKVCKVLENNKKKTKKSYIITIHKPLLDQFWRLC